MSKGDETPICHKKSKMYIYMYTENLSTLKYCGSTNGSRKM